MQTTISDFKTRLQTKIHGQSLNKVQDVYGLIGEAAGNLLLRVDPQETKVVANIENALYDQVYDYALPTDVKGDRIVALRPQINNSPSNAFGYNSTESFDRTKGLGANQYTLNFDSIIKTIRIDKPTRAGVALNECNTLTENGSWAVGSNATTLEADTIEYITGSGSLRFNISASGSTAYIENSTMTAVDLTNYLSVGAIFLWAYVPTVSATTSIDLRWGSDSSNYYSKTVTTNHFGQSFVTGWNLIRFDWSSATTTGSPTITAIDYLRATINYTGTAMTAFRIDSIMAKLPSVWEIIYYSKYLFRNSSGTWIVKPTADTDLINLDTEGVNALLYECAYIVAQDLGGEDSQFDVDIFKKRRDEVWGAYLNRYKSEVIKKRESYYSFSIRRR